MSTITPRAHVADQSLSAVQHTGDAVKEGVKLEQLFGGMSWALQVGDELLGEQGRVRASQKSAVDAGERTVQRAAGAAGCFSDIKSSWDHWTDKYDQDRARVGQLQDQKVRLEEGHDALPNDNSIKGFLDYLDGYTPLSEADLPSVVAKINETIDRDLEQLHGQVVQMQDTAQALLKPADEQPGGWNELVGLYGANDPLEDVDDPEERQRRLINGLTVARSKAYRAMRQRQIREQQPLLDDASVSKQVSDEMRQRDFYRVSKEHVEADFDKEWARLALFNHFTQQLADRTAPAAAVDAKGHYNAVREKAAESIMGDVEEALAAPTLLHSALKIFRGRVRELADEPGFIDSLAQKITLHRVAARRAYLSAHGVHGTALEQQLQRELPAIKGETAASAAASPTKELLRYGLFKREMHKTAAALRQADGTLSEEQALHQAVRGHAHHIMDEVEKLLPKDDRQLDAMVEVMSHDLIAMQKNLVEVRRGLEREQAKRSQNKPGLLRSLWDGLAGFIRGKREIVMPGEAAGRSEQRTERHYLDSLRLLRMFHFGNVDQNIRRGVGLLQAVQHELFKEPTKEKRQLLRDLSLLYGQLKTNGDTLELIQREVEHSIYIDTLMGETLPAKPLEPNLQRLADMVSDAHKAVTTWQGISNIPPWMAPLNYAIGANEIGLLMITGLSVFSNFRTVSHVKALHDNLSENQKRDLCETFMALNTEADDMEELYETQLNAQLYRMLVVRGKHKHFLNEVKQSWRRFKKEMKYSASTGERAVRVGRIFAAPFLFAIDTIAAGLTFAALGVFAPAAYLVTGKEVFGKLFDSVQNAYILNKKTSHYVNHVFHETHRKAEQELKTENFTKYWQKQLKSQIDKLVSDTVEQRRNKIFQGLYDAKICAAAGITLAQWQQLTQPEVDAKRHEYADVEAARLSATIKGVALRFWREQSEIFAGPEGANANELLQSLEATINDIDKVGERIDFFLDDLRLYSEDVKQHPDTVTNKVPVDERLVRVKARHFDKLKNSRFAKLLQTKGKEHNLRNEELERHYTLFSDVRTQVDSAINGTVHADS